MRVIVLAGGFDQIALINELKNRGHYTILVDYYDNPPAKTFANKHIITDLSIGSDLLVENQLYEEFVAQRLPAIEIAGCEDEVQEIPFLVPYQIQLEAVPPCSSGIAQHIHQIFLVLSKHRLMSTLWEYLQSLTM